MRFFIEKKKGQTYKYRLGKRWSRTMCKIKRSKRRTLRLCLCSGVLFLIKKKNKREMWNKNCFRWFCLFGTKILDGEIGGEASEVAALWCLLLEEIGGRRGQQCTLEKGRKGRLKVENERLWDKFRREREKFE